MIGGSLNRSTEPAIKNDINGYLKRSVENINNLSVIQIRYEKSSWTHIIEEKQKI